MTRLLITRTLTEATDRLDRARLQTLARHARAIATYSVGYDHIDLDDARFLQLPRTTLLPHIGSTTFEARTAMGIMVLRALVRWLEERKPSDNCLNPSTLQARASV
jgi:glyoxylate reductase